MAMAVIFVRISDPRFGGVYMTLLNSINNVGMTWPSTMNLWLVNLLTIETCDADKMEVRHRLLLLRFTITSNSLQGQCNRKCYVYHLIVKKLVV